MSQPNRAPSTTWLLRPDPSSGYVNTCADDLIALTVWDPMWGEQRTIRMTRADARLMARRINECLDATVKR